MRVLLKVLLTLSLSVVAGTSLAFVVSNPQSLEVSVSEVSAQAPKPVINRLDSMNVYELAPSAYLLKVGHMLSRELYAQIKTDADVKGYITQIKQAAAQSGLSAALIAAVIMTESGFNPQALSSAGARGLMQLMPETAEFIANKEGITFDKSRLFEPEYNITLGTAYIKYLVDTFSDTDTALCAYNAGPTRVKEWLLDPEFSDGERLTSTPYPATNYYLSKIKQNITIYTKFY